MLYIRFARYAACASSAQLVDDLLRMPQLILCCQGAFFFPVQSPND